jgi:hypothetical protein
MKALFIIEKGFIFDASNSQNEQLGTTSVLPLTIISFNGSNH